ncbi:low molecular weight protein-tyrosine-phosphatase [Ramlibacter rhizophilus]|uniref:protein-tyrosine-phosphatase n=1 Tax=Ramlibacter rhizophilus TaxID=1781167 RepID=A0A4Z0C120_9BURK|nr:low molecular weight protein-tyrosine-phosphatase [Ramlibacter rhizophilus]TFZ04210.1 low molecular weight phosphotyrosine protein phosphatase [Ramlibacter rhizophilus]
MNKILVVCEGNICRSPMAQGLLAQAMPQAQVQSAGLGAMVGWPADEQAVRLMAERGVTLRAHRAQQINSVLCIASELVLVMDTEQRQRVEDMYPQVRGRVFRVAEHLKQDVPDPYRQGELAFREALALIDAGTTEWLLRIQRL